MLKSEREMKAAVDSVINCKVEKPPTLPARPPQEHKIRLDSRAARIIDAQYHGAYQT